MLVCPVSKKGELASVDSVAGHSCYMVDMRVVSSKRMTALVMCEGQPRKAYIYKTGTERVTPQGLDSG